MAVRNLHRSKRRGGVVARSSSGTKAGDNRAPRRPATWPTRSATRMRTNMLKILHSNAKEFKEVDVGGELIRLTNNVMSRMLRSKRCSECENEAGDVKHLIEEIAKLTWMFNVSDYIWFCNNLDLQGVRKRVKSVHDRFDDMMGKIIREHEEQRRNRLENDNGDEDMKDLLDILLDISEDENVEIKFTGI